MPQRGQRQLRHQRDAHQEQQQAQKLRQYTQRLIDRFNQLQIDKGNKPNAQRGTQQT
nr:hypothetical protein PJ912_19660 [Pectobacterium colocasium]